MRLKQNVSEDGPICGRLAAVSRIIRQLLDEDISTVELYANDDQFLHDSVASFDEEER